MTTPHVAREIEQLAVASITPYARNSRLHDSAQVERLAASIREFGFTNPVLVDEHGGIVAGHGRVLAAQLLGMDAIPCIRLSHLTDAQRRAYVIADNRLGELSTWDHATLASELEDLHLDEVDLGGLGFDADTLGNVFDAAGLDIPDLAPAKRGRAPERDDAPTADDYADIGAGAVNDPSAGKGMVYPVLANLQKPDYARWKAWRGKRTDSTALIALLDRASHDEGPQA